MTPSDDQRHDKSATLPARAAGRLGGLPLIGRGAAA